MSNELNVGEYGSYIRFGLGTDITGQYVVLEFKKPDGTVVRKLPADGVAIANTDYINEFYGLTFLSGEHVTYLLEADFIDMAGDWYWRPEVTLAGTSTKKAEYSLLKVNP